MAQRDRAPEFGKWESDVRYTAYFEKAGKSNASSSSSKPVSPPVNAGRIHIGSGTRATQDTAMVRQRHRELLEAAELQHPLRTERQTRAEVGNHWRMATNPSHPRHQAPYQGVGVDALVHEIRSNPSRPRAGGGEGYPPPRVRNSSSESGGRAGIMPPLAPERSRPRPAGYPPPRDRNSSSESGGKAANMPPLAPERSRLRPLAERDRTPVHRAGLPRFGEWNVNGPSEDYAFTQAFEQLRDQKKTGTSTVAATQAPSTPSHSIEISNTKRRPKGCWPSWCSSWGVRHQAAAPR